MSPVTPAPTGPLLISLAAAAGRLGVSKRTLERWIAEDKPHPRPFLKLGGQLMIRPSSVDDFVDGLPEVE